MRDDSGGFSANQSKPWRHGEHSYSVEYLFCMVAYFCPLHASYFSRDYVNMQDTYVNMQDKYVNMQDNFVNMQDKNKMQLIYVNM